MQERCKIGVVIGNANSPHAINIMKGIDQASKECDVQLMYFMNVSSPYTAQLYPPDTSIGWDYQKSAIYDYARYIKADVLIMTYGMMSIFMKSDYGKQYLEYFRNVPCVLINEQTDRPNWTSIIVDNYNGMYELVEHLVRDHGYHNFAFLAGPPGNTDACQRKRAFLDVMKKYDLLSEIRRRRKWQQMGQQLHKYGNLLNRDFHADRPNHKWVTDISYIHTKQGILYLSMIWDLNDNSIVAYKTGTQQTVNLVLDTIRLAMKQVVPTYRDPEEVNCQVQNN